jgi:Zn ribbon nucleic-acid-binding protein
LTPDSRNLKKHKDELLFLWSVDSKNPPNFARMCFQEFLEEKIEVRRAVKCVFQQQKIANFMNWKKKKRNKFWFPKII